jgi:hypothetical protein
MSQNRNRKSSSSDKNRGSFLSRHRTDARGALQQSPILQGDMDKVMQMNYNGKREVTLRSVIRNESLRPFTQLNEQTLEHLLLNVHFQQNMLHLRIVWQFKT